MLIRAMADTDFAKAADLLFMLSGALPPKDLNEVNQKLIRAFQSGIRTYANGLPYREKSMTNVANDLIKILFQHECSADWSFLRITRAQETLDQSLMHLHPNANYVALTRQYFVRATWRARRQAMQPEALGQLLHQVHDAITLPSHWPRMPCTRTGSSAGRRLARVDVQGGEVLRGAVPAADVPRLRDDTVSVLYVSASASSVTGSRAHRENAGADHGPHRAVVLPDLVGNLPRAVRADRHSPRSEKPVRRERTDEGIRKWKVLVRMGRNRIMLENRHYAQSSEAPQRQRKALCKVYV